MAWPRRRYSPDRHFIVPREDAATRAMRLFLRRPVAVLMLVIAIFVVGAMAWTRIPVQQTPSGMEVPFIWMRISFRNADVAVSPGETERALTKPLEEMLAGVPGLDTMQSSSSSGQAVFHMRFRTGTPMRVTYAEVKDRVDRVRASLNEELDPPRIGVFDPTRRPAIEYGLAWADDIDLSVAFRRVDEQIVPMLEGLPGVANVDVSGQLSSYHDVTLRREDAMRLRIAPWQIQQAMRQNMFAMSAGVIEDGARRYFVTADSQVATGAELLELPIAPDVVLGDVADVKHALALGSDYIYLNGRPAVRLRIYRASTANTVEMCSAVVAALEDLRDTGQLSGFHLVKLDDQGEGIRTSVDHLLQTAISGGVWAFAILFLFVRRVRLTLLIMLNTPLALMIGLIAQYFLGYSINLPSLMGFTLAVGMLVDNAVVVAENISRHREMGASPETASARGAGEVLQAVVLATATSIVVFLPLMFLSGNQFLTFYLTHVGTPLCVSLAASLLVALVIIPLAARLLGGGDTIDLRRLHWVHLRRPALVALVVCPVLAILAVLLPTAAVGLPGVDATMANVLVAFVGGLGIGLLVALGMRLALAAIPLARGLDRGLAGTVNGARAAYEQVLAAALRHRLIVIVVTVAIGAWTMHEAGESLGAVDAGLRPKSDTIRVRVSLPPNINIAEAFDVFQAYNNEIERLLEARRGTGPLPPDITPDALAVASGGQLTWEPSATGPGGTLVWIGDKSDASFESLLAISDNLAWQALIRDFHSEAKDVRPRLPERVRRELKTVDTRIGMLPDEVVSRLLSAPSDSDGLRFVPGEDKGGRLVYTGLRSGLSSMRSWSNSESWRSAIDRLREDAPETEPALPFEAWMIRFNQRRGEINLMMDPDDPSWDQDLARKAIAELLPPFPGVVIRAGWGWGDGGSDEERVQVTLTGPDTHRLTMLADDVVRRLENAPGLVDVEIQAEEGRDELQFSLDRDLAASRDVDASTVTRAMAFALSGSRLPDLQGEDGPERLQLRYAPTIEIDPRTDRPVEVSGGLSGLFGTEVITRSGDGAEPGLAELRELVTDAPVYTRGLGEIQRIDRRTSLAVSAALEGIDMTEATGVIEQALASMALPTGYGWQRGKREFERRALEGDMQFAALAALFCVFALMAIAFESVFRPLVIIVTVPLALVGVAWMAHLTDMTITPLVMVGMVLLVGLVVNNGIVLVDLIRRNAMAGIPRDEAIADACRHRFRPILMTAATTVVGLAPMAAGSGTFMGTPWYPLARTVISGLLTSTVLTLVVVPVVYSLVDDLLEGMALSRGGRPSPLARGLALATSVMAIMLAVWSLGQLPDTGNADTADERPQTPRESRGRR